MLVFDVIVPGNSFLASRGPDVGVYVFFNKGDPMVQNLREPESLLELSR